MYLPEETNQEKVKHTNEEQVGETSAIPSGEKRQMSQVKN